jgi:hypothetical protein
MYRKALPTYGFLIIRFIDLAEYSCWVTLVTFVLGSGCANVAMQLNTL